MKSYDNHRALVAALYDLWFGDGPYDDETLCRAKIQQLGGPALEIACGSLQILIGSHEAFAALPGFQAQLERGSQLLIAVSVPWEYFHATWQWRIRRVTMPPCDGVTVLINEASSCNHIEPLQTDWYGC